MVGTKWAQLRISLELGKMYETEAWRQPTLFCKPGEGKMDLESIIYLKMIRRMKLHGVYKFQ